MENFMYATLFMIVFVLVGWILLGNDVLDAVPFIGRVAVLVYFITLLASWAK